MTLHAVLRDVEVILLDLDGTVLDFEASQREALRRTVDKLGLAWVEQHAATYAAINQDLWEAYERREIGADALRSTRWRRYLTALEVDADAEEIGAEYLAEFAAGAHVMEGADEALATLAAHTTVIAVTNGFGDVQHQRLERCGLDRYFSGVVVSDAVGAAKPDPRIFDVAFELAGHPPRDRTVIIGDSLTSDIAGGRAYGIRTVWINPFGATPEEHPRPDATVGSLRELV